jgi:serine protease Do
MLRKNILLTTGIAALVIGLIALPGTSKSQQEAPQDATSAPQTNTRVKIMRGPQIERVQQELALLEDEGGSWLGVETREVTAENAKELKLSVERGVVIGKILPDSPAAKAGLRDNDVITAINGQPIEGTAQFRRVIRETPAGRTLQLTVSRDGHAQTIDATLGKMQENHKKWMSAMPQVFKFEMPDMPEVSPMPEMPSIEWDGANGFSSGPRLGIDAEDISGQLGSFFGAPDGEGILVRDVNSGSLAEKAGVKAGDVITSLNGDRIRGVAELRSKLAAAGEGKTVKLGILRNKSSLTLDLEIPAMKSKKVHKMEMRTKI